MGFSFWIVRHQLYGCKQPNWMNPHKVETSASLQSIASFLLSSKQLDKVINQQVIEWFCFLGRSRKFLDLQHTITAKSSNVAALKTSKEIVQKHRLFPW